MTKRFVKTAKRIAEARRYLGFEYTIRTIDRELCLCRDLDSGFEIEISGLASCDGRRKICNYVCVWDVRNGAGARARSVAYIREPASLSELKRILDRLVEVYDVYSPPNRYLDVYAAKWLGEQP